MNLGRVIQVISKHSIPLLEFCCRLQEEIAREPFARFVAEERMQELEIDGREENHVQ